jgi:acyl carrier protein
MDKLKVKATISSYVARELLYGNAQDLCDDTLLLDLGVIDSMSIQKVIVFFESTFHVKIPDHEVRPEHFSSIDRMTAFIMTLKGVE